MKTFHLRFKGGQWVLTLTKTKEVYGTWRLKKEAVQKSIFLCYNGATHKKPISLRICKKDGTIQTEYTYPRSADPRKSKG